MTILSQLEHEPTTAATTNLGAFVRAFIECGLWSESDELDGTSEAEENGDEDFVAQDVDIDQLSQPSLAACIKQCTDFIGLAVANGLLPAAVNTEIYSQAGHDFWLTRNGHGVSFTDRELYGETQHGQDISKLLASLCDTFSVFPEVDFERGDDGLIHLYPLTITLHSGYKAPAGITGIDALGYAQTHY
jgi:hypothetical protein